MNFENIVEQFGWQNNRNRTSTDGPSKHDQRPPLRYPDLSDHPNTILILIIVLPFVFIILLCTLTYCCYRWKKLSKDRCDIDRSIGGHHLPASTIIHNEQYNPYTIEDLPPAYELISETKKVSFTEPSKTNPREIRTSIHDSNSSPFSS